MQVTSPEHLLDPAVSREDFHQVVNYKNSRQRELTDHEKHYLLNHHQCYIQFPSHTFGKQKRHFQRSWLTKYKGLTYSKSVDGGYCKYCVLFAQTEVSGQRLGMLTIYKSKSCQ